MQNKNCYSRASALPFLRVHPLWIPPASPGLAGTISALDSYARPWRPSGALQDTAHPSGHVGIWAGKSKQIGFILHFIPTHDTPGHAHICHWMPWMWLGSGSISTAELPGVAELRCSDRSIFLWILGWKTQTNWVYPSFLPPPMMLWAVHIYATECLAHGLAGGSISTAGFPGAAELRCSDRSVFLWNLGYLLECNAPS